MRKKALRSWARMIIIGLLVFAVGAAIGFNASVWVARQKQEEMVIEVYNRIIAEETLTETV